MQIVVVLEHDQSSSLVSKLGSKIYLFTVGFPVGLVNFPWGPLKQHLCIHTIITRT